MEILCPGTTVCFTAESGQKGRRQQGIITSVCIEGEQRLLKYLVAWWANGSRNEVWMHPAEIDPAGDHDAVMIGFAAGVN